MLFAAREEKSGSLHSVRVQSEWCAHAASLRPVGGLRVSVEAVDRLGGTPVPDGRER